MKNSILMMCLLLATSAGSAEAPPLFSSLKPGDTIASPLRLITLPKINPNRFELVEDEGKTVLLVSSDASAGTVGIPLTAPAATRTQLEWRWKVSNVLAHADIDTKSGDDFAARLYVFFDLPLSSLSFFERTKIRLVRMIWGEDVPSAVLCYAWDNKHPVGYSHFSPYTNRVHVTVLQSGTANIGKWMRESRDVAADFKNAFGLDMPAITGVAVGSDTDQTLESVRTWFGDVVIKQ